MSAGTAPPNYGRGGAVPQTNKKEIVMVNKVILLGFVGKAPEVRYTPGGKAVASIRLATSRSWTDKQSGDRKEDTAWHDVEVWGKSAEACGKHVQTGRCLYVEGHLKYERWTDKESGQERFRAKIVADSVRFLGKRNGNADQPADDSSGEDVPDAG